MLAGHLEGPGSRRTHERLIAAAALHGLAFLGHQALTGGRPGPDAARYLELGAGAAARFWSAPLDGSLAAIRSILQLSDGIPHDLGGGPSTDTMVGLTAVLVLATGGAPTVVAAVAAVAAFAGRWWLYRGLAAFAPDRERAAFLATFAVPSLGYWSTGLFKEAVALPFLGLVVFGLATRGASMLLAAPALLLLRPHVLLAMLPAATALFDAPARAGWLRVGLAVGSALLLAEVVPPLLGEWPLTDQIAWRRAADAVDPARSALEVAPAPADAFGWLALTASALAMGLLRPGVWEAHHASSALAGLENAAWIAAAAVGLARAPRSWWGRPGVIFALAFVALLAFGIGVTTTNLGTLSRYRSLLVPFAWWVALGAALGPDPAPAAPQRGTLTR